MFPIGLVEDDSFLIKLGLPCCTCGLKVCAWLVDPAGCPSLADGRSPSPTRVSARPCPSDPGGDLPGNGYVLVLPRGVCFPVQGPGQRSRPRLLLHHDPAGSGHLRAGTRRRHQTRGHTRGRAAGGRDGTLSGSGRMLGGVEFII